MSIPVKPVLLLILDGYGYRADAKDNAVAAARKPNLDRLFAENPMTLINASDKFVGLPTGQFGNSEVGHLNIGAGRVVLQDITRIDVDVAEGTMGQNPVLKTAIDTAITSGKTLHVLGLLSDGGVHSHENHIHTLIEAAAAAGAKKIAIHAFLDGRDTPPRSAETYLSRLQAVCDKTGAKIATISGRYWAMDRDKRWERLQPVYNAIVEGVGLETAPTALDGLKAAYARDENDEFVKATVIGTPVKMEDGDVVVFMNFRADRARQVTTALIDPAFDGFKARQPKFGYFCSATSYGDQYPIPVAYAKEKVKNGIGEYLASLGLKQLRIAETEKYPHVTFFFSGGEETPAPGEDRILISSPKVATYDLQPEMSAPEVAAKVVEAIESKKYDAIFCNFANCDMVGHTGIFEAAVKAVETVDDCVGKCVAAMQAIGGEIIITADHGNAELMYDHKSSQPHTQHTTGLVPFVYVGRKAKLAASGTGALKDIAPSLLAMMGLPKPAEMTGNSLVSFE